MSDQALAWKFAFGTLVLLFCAVAWVTRKEAQPRTVEPVGVPIRTTPASAPLAAASAPPTREPAPVDLPEAQDTPVRIHIALVEPPHPSQRPAVIKAHRPPAKHAAAKPHAVHVRHAHRKRLPHASPYAAGQPHYPFDSHERWRSREG